MTDLVVDSCVMCLYDKPKEASYLALFKWLKEKGVLVVNQSLMAEYHRAHPGGGPLTVFVDRLQQEERLVKVKNTDVRSFGLDKGYHYTCNGEDRSHAITVFLSERKKLVSKDVRLRNDVNNFKKVDKINPEAVEEPEPDFYLS